ncbi:MAG: helix-turn-helix transcriptional regulator [Acidobacteria bacterium]|nr:helix-turn-helix transcriptional regulator [Acidobacteriota bacterium]
MKSLRELFGKRLRELRTEKGYNQLYLATLASVSEDFLSMVERGITAPSFDTIEALATALDTNVTALFTFPGDHGQRQRVRMVKGKRSKPQVESGKRSLKRPE